MKWKFDELKGKEITLNSRSRTYRFVCMEAERLLGYNLKLFGFGPKPDPIFLEYSTINFGGQEHGALVKATKNLSKDRFEIEAEIVLTDPSFWGAPPP